jgi:hypothetical protein
VVAVTNPYVVAFAGLVQFLLCVLANGFQQPIPGAMSSVLRDHQRLVDKQRELIEHLIALHTGITRDSLRGVDIEAAETLRQSSSAPLGGILACLPACLPACMQGQAIVAGPGACP